MKGQAALRMNTVMVEGGALMQIYDQKLATIQLKRIRKEIVDLKTEYLNIDFQGLNDKLDFLEDILHLHDDRDIEVINIKRG